MNQNGNGLSHLSNDAIEQMLARLHEEQQRRSQPPPQPRGAPVIPLGSFIDKHGGDPLPVPDNDGNETRLLILRDGAQVEPGGDGYFFVIPQPGLEQLEAAKHYSTIRIDYLTADFNRLQLALQDHGPPFTWPEHRWGKPPADDSAFRGMAALKHLAALIVKERETLAQIESQLQADPVYAKQQQEEAYRQAEMNRRAILEEAARQELSSITI
jgi:hypothetical protein